MRKLGPTIVAASLLALTGLASVAQAAPPPKVPDEPSARDQRKLRWLSDAQRARLKEVAPIVVSADPIAKVQFGFDLSKMCTKYASWKRGTALTPKQLEAVLDGTPIADVVAS